MGKKLWQRRFWFPLAIFVVLLCGSIALSIHYSHNGTIQHAHDPILVVFIGATPAQFVSGQLLWLFLWFGYMSLPIFVSAGTINNYQKEIFTNLSVRIQPRRSAYWWPLKQLLTIEMQLLLTMGTIIGLTGQFIWPEQQLLTSGLFTVDIVMSQLLLLVMETVLEGYFGIVIGVVGPLVMIFLSFLQVPLMPLRFAIGSIFASDRQLLGAIRYQLGLIIGLVLIQIFYMPGRWGRYAANHT